MKFVGMLIILSLLVGCGGGGGSVTVEGVGTGGQGAAAANAGTGGGGAAGPVITVGVGAGVTSTATAPPTPTTTAGYAAKGIIQNATVYVCRIKSGAVEVDAQCAKGTTAADGSYSVALSDGWTGPVMVKVKPASDSRMFNEITGAYQNFDMVDGIRAVVATAGTPAYVTPFSEIAASAAIATGSLDATVVQQANAMVQSNFGVDLSIKPLVDLKGSSADPSALGKQIAMVQKLAQLVNASTTGIFKNATSGANCTDLACGMQAMRAMASSTTSVKQSAATTFGLVFAATVPINFPVLKMDGTIALMVMDPKNASDIQAKLKAAGLPNADGMGAAMKASIDQDKSGTDSNLAGLKAKAMDSNGNVKYDPPSTSTLSSLQQAKVMVNFLREALNRFSNSMNTGYLNKQQVRIDSELQGLIQPRIEHIFTRIGAMQLAVQLYTDASAGLAASQTNNGKTIYYRTNGSVHDAVWGGNYTTCAAEKASTDNSIIAVTCSTATPGSFYPLPSSGSYNGITSNLAGSLSLEIFKLTPIVGQTDTFTYGLLKWRAAVIRSTSNYSIPSQYFNIVGGPYNFDLTTRINTLDPSCVSPTNPAGYINTSWSDISGSICTAYLGTGTVTQTLNAGSVTGLTVSGTMPPSDSSNTRQIGYEKVKLNASVTDISTNTINSIKTKMVQVKGSGSFEAYGTPLSTTSVNFDPAKAVKVTLEDGSYLIVKRTLTNSNDVISSNAQEGTLKISFTAVNTQGVGSLTANDWVSDKNSRNDQPKTVVFEGTLSDISASGDGDILKGKFTMNRPNYQLIDSNKPIGFGNDDGASISFVGSVNAKQSADYIKATLDFARVYSATAKSADSLALKLEIAGGFVLQGSALGALTPGSSATIKLKNQDGIILSVQSGKSPILYASDEKTELGTFKDGAASSGGSAFYFIDGTVLSLY
jgi:hypothetical protein